MPETRGWIETFIDYPLEATGFVWTEWQGPWKPWHQQVEGERPPIAGLFSQQMKELEAEAEWRARGRSYDPTNQTQQQLEEAARLKGENPLFKAVAWAEQFLDYPIETLQGWRAENFTQRYGEIKRGMEGYEKEMEKMPEVGKQLSIDIHDWLTNLKILDPLFRMQYGAEDWARNVTISLLESMEVGLDFLGIPYGAFYGEVRKERLQAAESQARREFTSKEAWEFYNNPNLVNPNYILQRPTYPSDWWRMALNVGRIDDVHARMIWTTERAMERLRNKRAWKGPLYGKGREDILEYMTLESQLERLMWPRTHYWKQGIPVVAMSDWLAKKKHTQVSSGLERGRLAG